MKFEFSKLIVTFCGAVALWVTAFTLKVVRETQNLEPLTTLITVVFGALATALGFYYSKAKIENRIKLRKKYGAEIYNDVKGEDDYNA